MAGQLGSEDRDVGQRTGQGDGQRSVQSAGMECYVPDSWTRSNARFLSGAKTPRFRGSGLSVRCTKFAGHDEGARVEGIKDGEVIVLPSEKTHQRFVA